MCVIQRVNMNEACKVSRCQKYNFALFAEGVCFRAGLAAAGGMAETVKVVVRCRPMNSREIHLKSKVSGMYADRFEPVWVNNSFKY